jgi:hypothetical protein
MNFYVPLALYLVFFAAALFAPPRWSMIGFLLLSTIDIGSESASIGALNTAKAMVLPVILLWRFRAYAGHQRLTAAPVAWILLVAYVAIASMWSLYPVYALKLVGHLLGSMLILMMLLRASKGGYLTSKTIVIVSLATIAIAILHWFFLHDWGGEPDRLTTFVGAQSFAAFITALYCAVISFRSLFWLTRLALSTTLLLCVLFNGSRTWLIGLFASTLLPIFGSELKGWVKVVSFAATVVLGAALIVEFDPLMNWVAEQSGSNRIARTITDVYQGNEKSTGLGTFRLRRELFRRTIAAIEAGSPTELLFGHGTSNGALIAATISRNPDPNRALHDEWLRALYEWGFIGLALWLVFVGSLVHYSIRAMRADSDYAKPLFTYLPAFVLGLSGENIIAGAGNAVSVGLLLLIAFASISYRKAETSVPLRQSGRLRSYAPSARRFRPVFR